MDNKLKKILEEFISELMELLEGLKESAPVPAYTEGLTKRSLLELVSHESIVKEAYKDSRGIWTWGIGVTSSSGHKVFRYKDNPQTLSKVVSVFEWLVREKYLPGVLRAFKGHDLTETELAAALSFHYNTGSINKASWVKSFMRGDKHLARKEFMNWKSPSEIIPRRKKERDLFFDGVWSNDGRVTVFERVRRPSYSPDWSSGRRISLEGVT